MGLTDVSDRPATGASHTGGNHETLRLCVVGQRYQLTREYLSIYQALGRTFDLTTRFVDDGWPVTIDDIAEHDRYDAVMWFVRFRELAEREPFRWRGYRGMRLMYDQDAYQNFSQMAGARFLGRWPDVVRRNEMEILLCTGRATRDNLIASGVRAVWFPKAADTALFFPQSSPRAGFCYFGERYAARAVMLRRLRTAGIRFMQFRSSYFDLNDHLNRYLACFICNMEAKAPNAVARWLNKLAPTRGLTLGAAPEAMLKNFEVAAAGCTPICDHIDELSDLGFVDGDTAVTYRDFSELIDKARHFQGAPGALAEIGMRAANLVRTRHTWDDRARQLEAIIRNQRAPLAGAS